jgi:hypothetical protein
MLRMTRAESWRAHEGSQIGLDEGDGGALHRDVGAGSEGDADVGGGQGGGVVGAVAGHRDDVALFAQLADDGVLLLGGDAGAHVVDAELARDGAGGGLVVAAEHEQAQAALAQGREGARRDGVGQGEEGRELAVDRDADDGVAAGSQRLGLCGEA